MVVVNDQLLFMHPKKQEISVGEVVEASAMEDEGGLKG